MKRSSLKSCLVVLSLTSVACARPRSSQCLSTASAEIPLAPTSKFIQGGYIHFGDKTCTATFEVGELGNDEITLKGFSARHCRFENEGDNKKISISLHFEKTAKRSAGYIRAIPVKESFAERASKALQEFSSLNVGSATSLITDALRIPVHYDPWFGKIFAGSGSIICNNFGIIPKIPDPLGTLSHSCWSFLDVGVYDLRLSRSLVGESNFKFMSDQFREKKKQLSNFLQADPETASYAQLYRQDVNGVIGLLRLQKYARIAYILNHDLCNVTPTATVDTRALCSVQNKMIEIVGRQLIEVDESGTAINIFDKLASTNQENSTTKIGLSLADLIAGRRLPQGGTPLTFDEVDKMALKHAETLNGLYRATNVVAIVTLRDQLKKMSGSTPETKLSPSLFVGTNFVAGGDSTPDQIQYGQFSISGLSTRPDEIRLSPPKKVQYDLERDMFGITMHGTLRLGIEKQNEVVSFFPTDSGSMLFLKGVIPLMVLNTVNDNPTSGGASILVLPEAVEESVANAGNVGSTQAGEPKNRSNSTAQVKVSKRVATNAGCM